VAGKQGTENKKRGNKEEGNGGSNGRRMRDVVKIKCFVKRGVQQVCVCGWWDKVISGV
jgi:hypothetical protein